MSTNKRYWLNRNPGSSYYDTYPDKKLTSCDIYFFMYYCKMQIWTQTSQINWQRYDLTHCLTDEKVKQNYKSDSTLDENSWCLTLRLHDSFHYWFILWLFSMKCLQMGKQNGIHSFLRQKISAGFVLENRKESHWKSCNWRIFGIWKCLLIISCQSICHKFFFCFAPFCHN